MARAQRLQEAPALRHDDTELDRARGLTAALASLGFASAWERRAWLLFAIIAIPATTWLRVQMLSQPLLDAHPWRQAQTALTILSYFRDGVSFLQYPTTLGGDLLNFTREFPLYQFLAAMGMHLGLSLEVSSRLLTLFFFVASTAFFAASVRHVLGNRTAAWATLLFWALPFHVLYSRVCLIDVPTQAFAMAALYFALRSLDEESSRVSLALLAVTGLAAALMKPPIWLLVAAIVGMRGLQRWREGRRSAVWPLGILVLQLLAALAWAHHAKLTYSADVTSTELEWLVGPFASRFVASRWSEIIRTLVRLVLSDFLVIPLVASIWLVRRERFWVLSSLAACVGSLLLWFFIHQHHDYYFLIESPFLIAAAAAGIVALLDGGKVARSVAILVTVLAVWRGAKTAPLFDMILFDRAAQRDELRAITSLIDPDEVFVAADTDPGRWLYAERLITCEQVQGCGGIQDSVRPRVRGFFYASPPRSFVELERWNPDSVWIDGIPGELAVHRFSGTGPRAFRPSEQMAVLATRPEGMVATPLARLAPRFDLCGLEAERLLVDLGTEPAKRVGVTGVGVTVWFPPRRYLSLPQSAPLGCATTVTVER